MEKKGIKKFLPEIILAGVLALGALSFVIINNALKQEENLIATISRSKSTLMEIDLSEETEERHFEIQGKFTPMTISVKHNAIAVIESGCPTQYCVHQHYISTTLSPIVCAYNEVTITLRGGGSGGDIIHL